MRTEAISVTGQARALLDRRYVRGTTVTNCVVHIGLDLDDRPLEECRLCRADVENALCHAIAVNGWLNEWKADAEEVLRGLV